MIEQGLLSQSKQCSKCKEIKTPDKFYSNEYRCKSCMKEKHRAYVKRNRDKMNAYQKSFIDRHPGTRRKYHLKSNYGITLEFFNELYYKQDGRCRICGKHESALNKKLFVDHDHKTGRVRGLLCSNCNFMLGLSGDDVGLLARAIEYISGGGNVC